MSALLYLSSSSPVVTSFDENTLFQSGFADSNDDEFSARLPNSGDGQNTPLSAYSAISCNYRNKGIGFIVFLCFNFTVLFIVPLFVSR